MFMVGFIFSVIESLNICFCSIKKKLVSSVFIWILLLIIAFLCIHCRNAVIEHPVSVLNLPLRLIVLSITLYGVGEKIKGLH